MWNVEVRRERRLFPHFNSTFITPTEEESLGRTLVLPLGNSRSSSAFDAERSRTNVPTTRQRSIRGLPRRIAAVKQVCE